MNERQIVNPARLRFTWGRPKGAPAPWFLNTLCFFRRAKSPGTGHYYVSRKEETNYPLALIVNVRGVLLWTVGLSLSTLLGGAGLLASWYAKKPFNRITYADLALPWRWSGLEELRGQANLAQAQDDLHNGDIRSAFSYLRSGLARSPDETKARLDLATLYILFRIRPEAEKALIQAFEHKWPGLDYLHKSIALIEPAETPRFLADYCDRARAALPADSRALDKEASYIDETKVKALLALDLADEAVSYAEKHQPDDVALLQSVRISRNLLRHDSTGAEKELATWLAATPDSEEALAYGVRVCRAANKIPEMQASILRLRSRYPDNPNHIALALSETILSGQIEAALDLLDISVIRFANTPGVYGEWAETIGKTGNDQVLGRLEQLVRESNQDPQTVILARLMNLIRRQAWEDAEAASARLDAYYPNLQPRLQNIHNVAKALLATCRQTAKGSQNTLVNSIASGWFGIHLYRQVVDALANAERYDAALEVLTLAEGYYPTSTYITNQRSAISDKLRSQNAELARIAAKTAPTAEAAPDFADASAFFAVLNEYTRTGHASEALRLCRTVRKSAPAWLSDALPELEWREIILAAQADDLSLLQLNLRTSLRNRREALIEKVVAQAQTWHREKNQAAALIALREVITVQPAHNSALGLLAEWSPRSESGTNLATTKSSPPSDAPAPASLPSSATELFTALDALSATTHTEKALRLIREIRKADPLWLSDTGPDLDWREIQLAATANDLPLLQISLRTYLRIRPAETTRCLEQARLWHAKTERKSAALIIIREILRQTPDEPSATQLLAEWGTP